jgi:hypothetical protein
MKPRLVVPTCAAACVTLLCFAAASQEAAGDPSVPPGDPAPEADPAGGSAAEGEGAVTPPPPGTYAIIVPGPSPGLRTERWSWQATPPPAPVAAVAGRQPGRNPGKGLTIAGWIVFGAGYLVSAYIGALAMSGDDDDDDDARGWYMFIPIGGPVAFGVRTSRRLGESDDEESWNDDADETAGRFVGFLCCIPAIIQTVGLALALAGHGRTAKWRREYDISVAPVGPGGGPGLSIGGRFL